MKNSLVNMILVLGGITLVASAAVGMVYRVTADPIALAKEANTNAALAEVLPEFDRTSLDSLSLDGMELLVYTASQGGETVGYAVQTATQQGYSGEFKLMVGFTPGGEVRNVKVLEHKETPGLGSKMTADGNPLFGSFEGRNPSQMKLAVKKDGGDVDALTAATITSRAYVDAVARAFRAMTQAADNTLGTDAADALDTVSGATEVDGEWSAPEKAEEPAAGSIIGGSDGPTSIIVSGEGQPAAAQNGGKEGAQ